ASFKPWPPPSGRGRGRTAELYMLLLILSTACAGLFCGAALYINFVEHPARMSCGPELALRESRLEYEQIPGDSGGRVGADKDDDESLGRLVNFELEPVALFTTGPLHSLEAAVAVGDGPAPSGHRPSRFSTVIRRAGPTGGLKATARIAAKRPYCRTVLARSQYRRSCASLPSLTSNTQATLTVMRLRVASVCPCECLA